MSSWMHINGSIRHHNCVFHGMTAEQLASFEKNIELRIVKVMGPQSDDAHDIEDEMYVARTATIPMGSEGTIHYRITHLVRHEHKDGEIKHYYQGLFIVFGGDLRDVEEVDYPKIRQWFKDIINALADNYICPRQAVLTAQVSGGLSHILMTEDWWGKGDKIFEDQFDMESDERASV